MLVLARRSPTHFHDFRIPSSISWFPVLSDSSIYVEGILGFVGDMHLLLSPNPSLFSWLVASFLMLFLWPLSFFFNLSLLFAILLFGLFSATTTSTFAGTLEHSSTVEWGVSSLLDSPDISWNIRLISFLYSLDFCSSDSVTDISW